MPKQIGMEMLIAMAGLKIIEPGVKKPEVKRLGIKQLEAKRSKKVTEGAKKPRVRETKARRPKQVAKKAKSLLLTAFLLFLAFWQLVFTAKHFWHIFFFFQGFFALSSLSLATAVALSIS